MLLVLAVYIQYILHVLRTHCMYSMWNDAVSLPISLSILVPISPYIYTVYNKSVYQYTYSMYICILPVYTIIYSLPPSTY